MDISKSSVRADVRCQMAELYASGESIAACGRPFGLGYTVARTLLMEAGVTLRPIGSAPRTVVDARERFRARRQA